MLKLNSRKTGATASTWAEYVFNLSEKSYPGAAWHYFITRPRREEKLTRWITRILIWPDLTNRFMSTHNVHSTINEGGCCLSCVENRSITAPGATQNTFTFALTVNHLRGINRTYCQRTGQETLNPPREQCWELTSDYVQAPSFTGFLKVPKNIITYNKIHLMRPFCSGT